MQYHMKRPLNSASFYEQEASWEECLVATEFTYGKESKDAEAKSKSPEGGDESRGEQVTSHRIDP